jgi:hypothetical protein
VPVGVFGAVFVAEPVLVCVTAGVTEPVPLTVAVFDMLAPVDIVLVALAASEPVGDHYLYR